MKVLKNKCNQCLFTKNKIVSNSRRTDIIKDCLQNDTYFICHKSSMEGGKACCRGFWNEFKNEFQLGRIAQRLGMVQYLEEKDL